MKTTNIVIVNLFRSSVTQMQRWDLIVFRRWS